MHHRNPVTAHHQHFSLQSHIPHELHHTHLHLYQCDYSDPIQQQSTPMLCASCHTDHLILERIFLLSTSTCLRHIFTEPFSCLTTPIAFKTSTNTVLQQMLKMSSTRLHIFSQPLSKMRDNFVLQNIFRCFLHATFYSETVLASDEAFKEGSCISPQT